MIEDELATMPTSQPGEDCGQKRQHEAMGQDRVLDRQAHAPIHASDRDQHHGGYRVRPTCDTNPNARHKQKFGRADHTRRDTRGEGETGRPQPRANPEGVSRPPVEYVASKGGNHEGDGEMYAHRVQRMAGNSNGRADRFVGNFIDNRIVAVAQFIHGKSPWQEKSARSAHWFRRGHVVVAPAVLSACAGPLSVLEPDGPSAKGTALLWWVMLAAAAAIFLWIAISLILASFRPGSLRALGSHRLMLWGGIVIPMLILTGVVIAAFALGERLLAHPREPAPLRIEAVARMWNWEFRYPGGQTLTDVLHLPVGEDVDFVVLTEDVIHSFWIPRLGGKIDAIPGHENVIRLRADRPGVYGGVCAEYCGSGHPTMEFSVEAHEADAFAAVMATGEGSE